MDVRTHITKQRKWRRVLAASFFALTCAQAGLLAQTNPLEESWRWAHFSTSSGLPSNIVRDIKDAPDGTPWALTVAGPAWFDGFQWHAVESDIVRYENNFRGIIGFYGNGMLFQIKDRFFVATKSDITPFPVDSVSEMWVLAKDSVLLLRNQSPFVYAHGQLTRFPFPGWKNGMTFGGKLEHNHFIVWSRESMFAWDGRERRTIIDFDRGPAGVGAMAENAAREMLFVIGYPQSKAGLWESRRGERARRNPFRTVRKELLMSIADNGDAIVLYENNFLRIRRKGKWNVLNDLPDFFREVSCLQYRSNGDLWVATDHGLFLCRLSAASWTKHSWAEGDQRNRVNNILRARNGTTWLATSGGLVHVGLGGASTTVASIGSTPITVVTGLAEDYNGNIWISSGSEFTGAYRWDGKRWQHLPILQHGLGVYIHKIECDEEGRLWFLGLSKGWDKEPTANAGVYVFEDESVV